MPMSAWHGRTVGVIGVAHFFDAFDATAISFVLPVLIATWGLSAPEAGLLISASYVGQFIGAVGAGMMADHMGRLRTMRLSLLAIGLLSAGCALSPGYAVLLVMRSVQGLGLGAEPPVASTYMNEVFPARLRGRLVVSTQLLFGSGAVGAALTATLFVPSYGWRVIFVAGAVPILLAAAMRWLVPESPKWLAQQGRAKEADEALNWIEQRVYKRREQQAFTAVSTAPPHQSMVPPISRRSLLGTGWRRRTASAWSIAFFSATVGYGLIGWMPTVYRAIYGLPLEQALRYGLMGNLASLLGALIGILLIDRLGRKGTLLLGFGGVSLLLTIMFLGSATLSAFQIMLLCAGSQAFLGMPLSILYLYVPELYPTSFRALGTGAASAWQRVASIIAPIAIGLLLAQGIASVFLFLAIAAACGAVATAVLAIETHPLSDV
jgi:putative MFS transporter